MTAIDIDAVGAAIKAIAAEEIRPRFRALAVHDVHAKATPNEPDDVVTAADIATERRLGQVLRSMLPGSIVVGEEAAAAEPDRLRAIGGPDPVWVLDPLDGTKNFVAGASRFGTMVALLRRTEIAAAWIHLTMDDVLLMAEAGAGAFRNGLPLRGAGARPALDAATDPAPGSLQGSLHMRHLPPDERAALVARRDAPRPATGGGVDLTFVPSPGTAAFEYAALAEGRKDFVVYHRLWPWDHAPGALIVREAGGLVRHLDGDEYRPTIWRRTLLAARTEAAWSAVHGRLFAA